MRARNLGVHRDASSACVDRLVQGIPVLLLLLVKTECVHMLTLLIARPHDRLEALEQSSTLQGRRTGVVAEVDLHLALSRFDGRLTLECFRYVHELADLALACHIQHEIVLLGRLSS